MDSKRIYLIASIILGIVIVSGVFYVIANKEQETAFEDSTGPEILPDAKGACDTDDPPENSDEFVVFNDQLCVYTKHENEYRELILIKNGYEVLVAGEESSETVVDGEAVSAGSHIHSPRFSDDGRYLLYEVASYAFSDGYIYDVLEERDLGKKFSGADDEYGFSADGTYFYSCALQGAGVTTPEGQVYRTPEFYRVFNIEEDTVFNIGEDMGDSTEETYWYVNECAYVEEEDALYFKLGEYDISQDTTIQEEEFKFYFNNIQQPPTSPLN